MTRVALFGCGLMGSAAALDLATGGLVRSLVLVDRDRSGLRRLADSLERRGPVARLETAVADPADPRALAALLDEADVVAAALPWGATRTIVEACLPRRLPIASITRPDGGDLAWLEEVPARFEAPVLLPLGLEPGLTEILARRVAEELERVGEIHVRCGGVPLRPRGPLRYTIVFGGDTLPIGWRDAHVIVRGRLRRVPRFTGVERFEMPEVGTLEAYHDGLPPWVLSDPVLGRAEAVTQKTLRWPGFAAAVRTLGRLGLLAEEPVAVDGVEVVPKRVVEAVLAPHVRWEEGDEDVVHLRAEARGEAAGVPMHVRAQLTARFDPGTGLTAMARATGFTLAAATRLLASGELEETGWLQPQRVVTGRRRERLLGELAQRGLEVRLERTAEASADRP